MRNLQSIFPGSLNTHVVIVTLLTFAPVLASVYVSDDALRAEYSQFDLNYFLSVTAFELVGWWHLAGRLLIIPPFVDYLPLLYFNNLSDYKLFCYIGNIVVVAAFARLLFKLYGLSVALLCPIFISLVFQLRDYHDAALAFGALYQSAFTFFIISALFAIKFNDVGGKALFLSALFLILGLLTTEVVYSLIPFLIYVVGKSGNRFRFKIASVTYLISAVVVFLVARFGGVAINPHPDFLISSGYRPNVDAALIVSTFAKQLFAGFPLSYFSLKPEVGSWGVVSKPFVQDLNFHSLVSLSFLCAAVFVSLLLFKAPLACLNRSVSIKDALYIFILLGIFPAAVISISPKYQSELVWGIGYLPVYVQLFGVAASLSIVFIAKAPILFRVCNNCYYGLIFAIVAAIGANHLTNWQVVYSQRTAWHSPLVSDNLVLNSSGARSLCQNRVLLVEKYTPWINDKKFLVRRLGISDLARDVSAYEGVGCIFGSAFSSSEFIAILIGPVNFKNGEVLVLEETRRFIGVSTRSFVEDCDQSCVRGALDTNLHKQF